MSALKFDITISGGDVLSADDIWPDGDGPKNPTAEDVARRIATGRDLTWWLRDWNMDETIEVHVDGVKVRFR